MRKMRVLTEASGSLTAGYIIRAIQDAGHIAVASDIDVQCTGRFLADEFVEMPSSSHPSLWEEVENLIQNHRIDVVIPSLDEMLEGWAERKEFFLDRGVHVIVSDVETLRMCMDKWATYEFFERAGIPTPRTSLEQKFALVKPRRGRGGVGVAITDEPVSMDGNISQEVVDGEEYTVDVFCDRNGEPGYIVPRRRERVVQGKSLAGTVCRHEGIENWVRKICKAASFRGPVNMQCFVMGNGEINFIEINPRLAGGMALGFAATENWIQIAINHWVESEPISWKPVRDGLQMKRYYAEVFVSA